MKAKIVEFLCNKCGEHAPLDEKNSTQQWNVYKTKENCKCGGKFEMTFK